MTHLEPFGWWHIPDAVAIERQLFAIQPWSEAQFWSELAAPGRVAFAASADGVLQGYAFLALGDGEAEILSIGVREQDQGVGIGRALLEAMLRVAQEAGATRVLLEARKGNVRAIELYTRNGFTITGERPNYYALGVDAVLMERHV